MRPLLLLMRRMFQRSIFWMVPLILGLMAALFVQQYKFLRSLESASASAERNYLRNSLELVTQEIEALYRARADAALTMSEARLRNVMTLGEHFRTHRVPGARTFFAIRYRHQMSEWGTFDSTGWEREPMIEETEAIKMATVFWQVAHKMQRIVPNPTLSVDERDPRHRVIMRPVTDESMHVTGVVGVVLDETASKSTMLAIGAKTLKKRYRGNDLSLRIGDRFPTMPRGREFITTPLSFIFTNWRAGIRDACMGPEEIAAYNFRVNMGWTGGGAFILLCAIALAIQAAARQMRLSQMKSDFVSNVSHELRTPLSSIRVFGEYMRLGRVTREEKIREYGEYIEAESRRLTQLINNILDFSKIESAEKKYRFCETDVVDLVASIVGGFEVPLREHGFAITFAAPAERPPLLHIDKDAIGQVIVNLLDNAVKYSGERKEIDVRVTYERDEVRIAVRDRGIGIPAVEQKKIFEKFYRVGSGLVHDVKGSGLGLAIVRHVVKAHGGRVDVTSAPGDGSTFMIVLPATNGRALSITPQETTA